MPEKDIALGFPPLSLIPVCTKVSEPYSLGCNLIIVLHGLLPVSHFRAQSFGFLWIMVEILQTGLWRIKAGFPVQIKVRTKARSRGGERFHRYEAW